MSKSSKAKIKTLLRIKSPEKENKELNRSESFKDGAPASPEDKSEPPSPGPVSPGDSATLPGHILPTTAREKKRKKLFSFKLKLKKSRSKTEGDEVDFSDTTSELSSFSSLK